MRNLERDTRDVWVSLYESKSKRIVDGVWAGDYIITRSTPVLMHPSLSAARGSVNTDVFGVAVDYDRTAIFHATDTGITETAVFWVDRAPSFDDEGNLEADEYGEPVVPWDYIVALIAVSSNVTSVALRKADVQ